MVPSSPEIPAVDDAAFYGTMQLELENFLERVGRPDLKDGPFFAPSINYGRAHRAPLG